ncbi:hypothetical protein RD110_00290 [Rhodoferax koreense]|uniref:Tli3-like domain-containing protein n=1 Tax=Rhodoferax koreensis TaxID=1842727 RepID=A0A1P8JQ29_9BURK|nr:hypothetical protein [Rhodoferax koreense]APW35845.1 hypothetical protein RD110_00290 [Rhodoferax koreense]
MNIKNSRFQTTVAVGVATLLLTACGVGGPYPDVPELLPANSIPVYRGPVAPPQITYRIDENRYFEYLPRGAGACTNAMVYYNDKKLGIRSAVVELDRAVAGASNFIIDAANDQYLVGPMTRGNTDCSSGGGGCGGATLPYSTDGGRTWNRAIPGAYGGYAVYMSGDQVYTSGMRAKLSELSSGPSVWTDDLLSNFPPPRRQPLDKKFRCTANGKE